MAVVLERYIAGHLSAKNVVDWLINGKCQDKVQSDILGDAKLQTEFLPYFINNLRDQTAHLVCRGSSAVSSPARTPSSLQKLKRAPTSRPQRSGGSKANRTQLFASDSAKSTWSDKDFTPVSRLPLADTDNSPVKNTTPSLSGKSSGRHGRNVSWSAEDSGPRRKTPVSGSRKDESITLAQFLVTPDSQPKGKGRKSPFGESGTGCDSASSNRGSSGKRRSSGKGKHSGQGEGSGSKGQRWRQVEKPPVFDLGNSQEFPSIGIGSPSVRTLTPRRITPTAVSATSAGVGRRVSTFPSPAQSAPSQEQSTGLTLRRPEQSSTFNPPVSNPGSESPSSTSKPSLDKERELLKQERLKQKAQQDSSTFPSSNALVRSPGGFSPHTPTKLMRSNSVSSMTDAVPPDVAKVTHQDKLDLIAELYAVFLQESLVPNLAVELYFLIQLLTAKGSKLDEEEGIASLDADIEDINFLSSIHNCVYFAASVLTRLVVLLSLLDKSTLRLLAESQVVSQFNPELKSRLEGCIERCPLESGLQEAITSPMQVVPFLADTDNRKNFPSDSSFHSFKKHRDGFYGLVREWEENHNKPGWKIQDKLGHRVRDLVRPMDVTNYTHFARLFQSQLIKMCQGDSSVVDSGDSQELSFIQQLRRTNPGKFKRLEDRFSTPASIGGPCPPPSFRGCQGFFKNFIIAADSYTFNQHLVDSFATKVVELNDFQLGMNEQTEVVPVAIDHEQHESFSSCLLALRVLAKFLGFLAFLPYQGGEQLPDTMKENAISLRSKAPLPVDLLGCLATSDANHRLILTLPWVVEYLSMMDGLAAQIEHYHNTLSLLADVHKRVSLQWTENPANHNVLLILLVLGWLFENPALPSNLHLTSGINVDRCYRGNKPGSDQSLDHLPLVDRHILYTCCPFLGDLRVLLSEASLGVNNKSAPVKKITPVAVDTPNTAVINETQIQMELEKNFFHNHSTSLKKSVEFVSGRVASNCIKSIDGSLVSRARLRVPEMLAAMLASCSISKKETGAITAKAKQAGTDLSRDTEDKAKIEARGFISQKCLSALEVLLPCDTSQPVLTTACSIASRLGYERTEKWIMTQIQSAIQQEVSSQLPRCLKAQGLGQGQSQRQGQGQGQGHPPKKEGISKKLPAKPERHDRSATSPSTVIQQLKDCVRGLLVPASGLSVTLESIHSALDGVQCMLGYRQDLTPLAYQSIHSLTLELCVTLVSKYPDYLTTPCRGPCGLSKHPKAGLSLVQQPGCSSQPSSAINVSVNGEKSEVTGATEQAGDDVCPNQQSGDGVCPNQLSGCMHRSSATSPACGNCEQPNGPVTHQNDSASTEIESCKESERFNVSKDARYGSSRTHQQGPGPLQPNEASIAMTNGLTSYRRGMCEKKDDGSPSGQQFDSGLERLDKSDGVATETPSIRQQSRTAISQKESNTGSCDELGGSASASASMQVMGDNDQTTITMCNGNQIGQDKSNSSAIIDNETSEGTSQSSAGSMRIAASAENAETPDQSCAINHVDDEKRLNSNSEDASHILCRTKLPRDGVIHKSLPLSLLDRLVFLWSMESSPRVPVLAFLSARTAWVMSGGEHEMDSWHSIVHILHRLCDNGVVSNKDVQSALGKLMMSSQAPPITEDKARIVLPLVSTKELSGDEKATDLLRTISQEALEKEDKLG